MTSTERVRLCRMRAYRGQLLLTVRVADGIALVDWLESAGYLPPRGDPSKVEIGEGLSRYVNDVTRFNGPDR